MTRTLLWLLGGLIVGGIVHVVVVLTLPALAEETAWDRLARLGAEERVLILDRVEAGEDNPLGLDPEMIYGVCRVDLSQGPAYMHGILPDAFWSLAVYDRSGTIVYATTNRDGIGRTLDLGIFNAAQTRQLAQQELDIEEGVLVIEADSDDLFIVVRLAPYVEAVRPRYTASLSAVTCGTSEEG